MRKDLQALIELQKEDQDILSFQDQIRDIPLKIKSVEQPLLDAKKNLESQKKRHEEFLKKKKDKELRLDEIRDKINKSKARTSEIKTNKEYQAHLKEIETIEEEKNRIEDDVLELMVQSDDMAETLKKAEAVVKGEEGKIEEFKKTLDRDKKELERALDDLKSRRNRIASGISENIYNKYMLRVAEGQGIAVSEVKDEVCQGCYMNIPPQLYVEVRKGEDMKTCPQCGRFLYYMENKDKE